MDKKKATLTLTKKLNEIGCISLVTNQAAQSYLLNNAKSVVLDLKKTGRVVTHCLDPYYFNLLNFESSVNRNSLPTCLRDYAAANYFFIEKHYDSSGSRFHATPAAIIGEAEEQVLRTKFYKNVPEEVSKAFEILNIPNFIEAYNVYSSLKADEVSPFRLGIYHPFKKKDKVELGDIVQGATSKRYYLVDKIKSDRSIEGYRFQDEALKTPATGKRDDKTYGECDNSYIIPIKKRVYNIDFFDFMFTLPYEEQNVEVNREILKLAPEGFDYAQVLVKEYSKGEHFQDYFDCLNPERQNNVVNVLSTVIERNLIHDSFLWAKGFKEVKPDYLDFYKTSSQKFIEYFSGRSAEEKKVVLRNIMDLEFINDDVTRWLNEHETDLMREVGFNG